MITSRFPDLVFNPQVSARPGCSHHAERTTLSRLAAVGELHMMIVAGHMVIVAGHIVVGRHQREPYLAT